ncbi:chloride channel protein [Propionicicella superfundia]|uniref:chloride channel protein n=1 Tax=Propionicicella superfundia TaxID=348582 RepID=UPI000419801E|nr:chloride channel protein [Propionicicella superfundia]
MKFGARVDPFASRRTMAVFIVAALVAAVGIGVVGGCFRWCLERLGELRAVMLEWVRTLPPALGWLVPVVFVAVCAVVGQFFARITPRAAGSGIQDVEAVWREEHDLPGPGVIPARFAGGLVAIGSGLVLGREGPSVHLGASIGSEVGRWFRLSDYERKLLYTTVGGAGLAVAFNAPVGGALFTVEEVTRSVRLRVVLLTLVTTSVAVGVSRYVEPGHFVFSVPAVTAPPLGALWIYVVFGLLVGLLGVGYNAVVMGMLRGTDRLRVPAAARAGAIGAAVGLLLWIDPLFGGGGDDIAQMVLGGQQLAVGSLLLYAAVRFVAGPLSYAAGAPGGLFAPLLALGALLGVLFHDAVMAVGGAAAAGVVGGSAVPFAVVGMAAFFTATVRAPLTAVVLIVEMTNTASLTTVMFAACAAAVLAATAVKGPPIYHSLRERMLAS